MRQAFAILPLLRTALTRGLALATILWLLALRREKLDVSFGSFLKVGAVAMPAALLLSVCAAIPMQALSGIA